jgi:hypothetical protein
VESHIREDYLDVEKKIDWWSLIFRMSTWMLRKWWIADCLVWCVYAGGIPYPGWLPGCWENNGLLMVWFGVFRHVESPYLGGLPRYWENDGLLMVWFGLFRHVESHIWEENLDVKKMMDCWWFGLVCLGTWNLIFGRITWMLRKWWIADGLVWCV